MAAETFNAKNNKVFGAKNKNAKFAFQVQKMRTRTSMENYRQISQAKHNQLSYRDLKTIDQADDLLSGAMDLAGTAPYVDNFNEEFKVREQQFDLNFSNDHKTYTNYPAFLPPLSH